MKYITLGSYKQLGVLVHMISDTLPPFFFADIVPEIAVV